MTSKKKIVLTGIATTIATLAISGTAFAATGQGFRHQGENRPQMTAEQMAEHHKEMETKIQESLTSSVTSGKITEEQKNYILQKQDEIHAKMVAGDRDGAKALKDELRSWMETNNIDRTVMPGGRHGRGNGMGQHRQ